MRAQFLYDFREEWEFCSGEDLHEFFREQVGGPSPSGRVEIDAEEARGFVLGCLRAEEHNSPSLREHCERAREALESTLGE